MTTEEKSSMKQFIIRAPVMALCNGVMILMHRSLLLFDGPAITFHFCPKSFLIFFQYPECTHCFQHNQTIIAQTFHDPSSLLNPSPALR